MRVEEWHGRKIVCEHIFPANEIKVGSIWQGSSGSLVEITEVKEFRWTYKNKEQIDFDVFYKWVDNGKEVFHNKDSFSFQCRYCLVTE
jgi:hypothetical protein